MIPTSRPIKRRHCLNAEAVDRISELPDTILWKILYYVSTKTAVMTSILSKRWQYVWTGVPVLDFTEMPSFLESYATLTLQQRTFFRSFVDRVLLHNDASSMQYMLLTIDKDCYFYLKSWLSAIAKREIAHIDIRVLDWADVVPVDLPANFFTSETLVYLELWGRFKIDAPWSLHLPNLEFAHLQLLKLPDDDFLKKFSSSCPKLQELRIVDCEGLSTLYVDSSTLEILHLEWNMDKIKLPHAHIVIRTPNLQCLKVEEHLKGHVKVTNELSLLEEAKVNIEQYSDIEYVLELLRNVAGVKTLRLGEPEDAGFPFPYLSNLPIFQNLTCLKLASEKNLYPLLECAPNLKSLIVEKHVLFVDFQFVSKPAPKCLSCLDCVQFNDFKATKSAMAMVAYFLKNAIVLKEAKLDVPPMTAEKKAFIFQRLLVLPRSSAACQVKVSVCRSR